MAAVKPGVSYRDFHVAAMTVLAHGLADMGILPVSAEEALDKDSGVYRRWTLHGTGHMLGLDVHDCSAARSENYLDGKLEPGMVLTVEPGLYFQSSDLLVPESLRGIGIRIEDDVVVTEDGCRNLSGRPRPHARRRRGLDVGPHSADARRTESRGRGRSGRPRAARRRRRAGHARAAG